MRIKLKINQERGCPFSHFCGSSEDHPRLLSKFDVNCLENISKGHMIRCPQQRQTGFVPTFPGKERKKETSLVLINVLCLSLF